MPMSDPDPNADHAAQTPPEPHAEPADQTGVDQPADAQGFWQEPTEPLEKAFQPITNRSQEDTEQQ